MKIKRPRNLNLFTIRFPIPALASILHRLSGFILFLMIPLILWGFHLSLDSEQGFNDLQQIFTTPWVKFVVWVILSAFLYHLVAGIRHLLMDIGVGEGLKSGKLSAILTLALAAVLIILAGIWLW
ncbi:MAG TPA: succinate dehydrogenase, cytochrome b556 subunit [Gammaproteobacteria bacterium]|nr:succinate dehydrogenase, cytochrome b556 subunit [Gammaproteobacteria bacterium]